jgi:hypothetical protein
MTNQRLFRFLITISKPKSLTEQEFLSACSHSALRTLFENLSKKYVFQLERGTVNNGLHYQCFISLKVKSTKKQLLKEFHNCFGELICNTTNIQQSNNEEKSVDYCSKENRAAGPWTSNDVQYQGDDLDCFETGFYPWQKHVYSAVSQFICEGKTAFQNNRQITLVLDKKGNSGKTLLAKKFLIDFPQDIGYLSLGNLGQMTSVITSSDTKKVWIIDLSRTMVQMKDDPYIMLFNLIESLKNGIVHSCMHGKPKLKIFPPPLILVFTNTNFQECADIDLSEDRWHILDLGQSVQSLQKSKVSQCELYGIADSVEAHANG